MVPPTRYTKNPSPNTPNTIEGTPGTTAIDISTTISTLPKMAGKMPPSVFASRGSVVTNSKRRSR
jgi:hypothetical protein